MAQLMSMKCVVVGDGAVGKTCMLQTFSLGHFPKDYVPTGTKHNIKYLFHVAF